ncbi:MAG TPA: hypothetical protein VGK35_10410 [Actinotalea sp.]
MARHLVMAGRLLEDDPELAYEHAQAAARRAGRVDVVREAAALTAYRTGRYAEALRELRTVRRLNGSDEHLALMADCERGLGRPDRALAVAQEEGVAGLPLETQIELAIVVSGARLDLGDPDAALAALGTPVVRGAVGELALRVSEARATALDAAGRSSEAEAERATLAAEGGRDLIEDEIVVFDLEDDEEQELGEVDEDDARGRQASGDETIAEPQAIGDGASGVDEPSDSAPDGPEVSSDSDEGEVR